MNSVLYYAPLPFLPCEGTRIGNVVGLADDRDLVPERAEDRARGGDLHAGGGGDPQGGAENNEGQEGKGGRRHLGCCGPAS